MPTHITNKEVDDGFYLTITFESGAVAFVEVGTYNFIAMPRFYMQCKDGSAFIEDWQKKCKVAKLKAWNEKEVLPVQTAAGITAAIFFGVLYAVILILGIGLSLVFARSFLDYMKSDRDEH